MLFISLDPTRQCTVPYDELYIFCWNWSFLSLTAILFDWFDKQEQKHLKEWKTAGEDANLSFCNFIYVDPGLGSNSTGLCLVIFGWNLNKMTIK